jgi:hypothetical protein
MRRSLIVELAFLTALIPACGPKPSTPESPVASLSGSALERIPLPVGFPIPPGASPVAMSNDDAGLIGLWTTEAVGSTVYDFFVRALPAAGYRIKGAYAGDTVAQFLFTAPSGGTLQIDLYLNPNTTTRIEVRLPRP